MYLVCTCICNSDAFDSRISSLVYCFCESWTLKGEEGQGSHGGGGGEGWGGKWREGQLPSPPNLLSANNNNNSN